MIDVFISFQKKKLQKKKESSYGNLPSPYLSYFITLVN